MQLAGLSKISSKPDPIPSEEHIRLADIPEIERQSTLEKLILIEDLWESIANEEFGLAVPQSHIDELDKRLSAYESHPGNLLSLRTSQSDREKKMNYDVRFLPRVEGDAIVGYSWYEIKAPGLGMNSYVCFAPARKRLGATRSFYPRFIMIFAVDFSGDFRMQFTL